MDGCVSFYDYVDRLIYVPEGTIKYRLSDINAFRISDFGGIILILCAGFLWTIGGIIKLCTKCLRFR